MSININIFGSTCDADLYFAQYIANRISGKSENVTVEFESMLEIDYISRILKLCQSYGGNFYSHKLNHIILINGEYFGDLLKLMKMAIEQYDIDDAEIANTVTFQRAAEQNTVLAIKGTTHPAAYINLALENVAKSAPKLGRIVIELFSDLCPKACENFLLLCTGKNGRDPTTNVSLTYEGCPIHRIVKGGWIQSGDILDGSGSNSISAFGSLFEDECFSVDFGCPLGGIVGYSSDGPHSNGSQFFITLGPCDWMNYSKVGFGRVISGYSVLKELQQLTLENERPENPVIITSCGKFA